MGTFKAYLSKEIMEAIRQYKYVILLVGILFFAIADPIMMKILPEIIRKQGNINVDLSSLFITNRQIVLQKYIADLFQTGSMVVIFATCSALSNEISSQKFVLPYSKGGIPWGIVLAKVFNYSLAITLITVLGFSIDFYYVNLFFTGQDVAYTRVLLSSLLISLYFITNIILVMFFSSVFKKGIFSGVLVLFIGYFSAALITASSKK